MPVFYYPNHDNKIMGLLTSLEETFGISIQDAVRVETNIEILVPMLEKLQLDIDMPKQPKPKAEPENHCIICNKPIEGRAKCCSKSCYSRYYKKQNPGYKSKASAKAAKPEVPALPEPKVILPDGSSATQNELKRLLLDHALDAGARVKVAGVDYVVVSTLGNNLELSKLGG